MREESPSAIHFAEQRVESYSMKGSREKMYTVDNNLNATHNTLCEIVASSLDVYLLHLRTMGVYGYGMASTKVNMELVQGKINTKL